MKKIVVINAKGGCGKTTIATNLAAGYAMRGMSSAIMDYDSQGSSSVWLGRRPDDLAPIHGIRAYDAERPNMTRSWLLRMPAGVERVVVDTPGRLDRQQMQDLIQGADALIVPVLPSPIDIRAASRFIGDLLLVGRVRQLNRRLAVVANRVRPNTLASRSLMAFLGTLDIPVLASLRDVQIYAKASEQGLGILEMGASCAKQDRLHWEAIFSWLERGPSRAVVPSP